MTRVSRERVRLDPPPTLKQPNRETLFGCIPHALCRDPRDHALSAFTLALMGTIASIARFVDGDAKHAEAREGGRRSIALEKSDNDDFKRDWTHKISEQRQGRFVAAPQRIHIADLKLRHKPKKLKKAIKAAGKAGYASAKEALRKQPIMRAISFETSRSALAKAALFRPSTRTRRAIDAALRTLSGDIRLGDEMLPPFLTIEHLLNDRIILRVTASWLNMQYQRVPLPLPIKSPLATHLLLWLITIKPRQPNAPAGESSAFISFCERFDVRLVPWRAQQAIDRAVDHINSAYLPELDRTALRQFDIKLPGAYELVPDNEGRQVRFVGHLADAYSLDRAKTAREARKANNNVERRVRNRPAKVTPVTRDEQFYAAFEKWRLANGGPSRIDHDDMTPAARRELQALQVQFEEELAHFDA